MSNQNQAPVHLQLVRQILAAAQAQGLPAPSADPTTPSGLPENEGFVFIEWGPHGVAPALIVPKSKNRMGALHSHLDLSDLDGHVPLPRRNGRVACHFEPDAAKVSRALARFIGASKAPARAPVRGQSSASQAPVGTASQAAEAPVAQPGLTDMFPGLAADPDEEVDAALRALQA